MSAESEPPEPPESPHQTWATAVISVGIAWAIAYMMTHWNFSVTFK